MSNFRHKTAKEGGIGDWLRQATRTCKERHTYYDDATALGPLPALPDEEDPILDIITSPMAITRVWGLKGALLVRYAIPTFDV